MRFNPAADLDPAQVHDLRAGQPVSDQLRAHGAAVLSFVARHPPVLGGLAVLALLVLVAIGCAYAIEGRRHRTT